jgi:putative ABC transport system permease protein
MHKSLYPRLALTNLKNNKKFYLPYLLACMGTLAMFCVLLTLTRDPAMLTMEGGATVQATLMLGCVVVGIFSCIILFYTSSVLTKQRKKEFGLYNILGMEKRHIGLVLLWESIYSFLISLAGGIIASIVFSKLLQLVLLRLLGGELSFTLRIDLFAVGITAILFAAIFFVLYLNTLRIIHTSKPVDLLHGSNQGEREPKSKWVLAVLGIICLVIGYTMSIMTKGAAAAILLFFVAVLFVIAGTYLLFTAFSIVALKAMRRNKNYYYQTSHFATVSGMLYRMKRNAASLASICILSTMVLVTVSTTVCLYLGVGDIVNQQHPTEIEGTYYDLPVAQRQTLANAIFDTAQQEGRTVENGMSYLSLSFAGQREGTEISTDNANESASTLDEMSMVFLTDAEGYTNMTGKTVTLAPGQMLGYSDKGTLDSTLTLFGKTYQITPLDSFPVDSGYLSLNVETVYLVVDSEETLSNIETQEQQTFGDTRFASSIQFNVTCDLDGTAEEKMSCAEEMERVSSENVPEDSAYNFVCRTERYQAILQMYGSMFFIGILLGTLFLLATVLIIYYKQISEGYDDRERFEIMQKVGMTEKEVKGTIRSQVLIVFFLPLVAAAIHIVFAYPMVSRIMMAFGMMNTGLFTACTAASLGIFAVIYIVVYLLTSRSYYSIVSKKE